MLSIPDTILEEVGETIYKVSADEHMRQVMEAREDAIRNELDVQYYQETLEKKLSVANAALADKDAKLDAANSALADKDAKLTEANARIAELKRQLADMKAGKEA